MLYALAFAAESLLHLVASGSFGQYWQSGYNRFETALVVLTFAGILTGSPLLTLLPAFRLYTPLPARWHATSEQYPMQR